MAARRSLHWGTALRDIKDDRAARADVRCEALKVSRDKNLVAWRGRSGCRYVFRILSADTVDASDLRDMVVLGVDADGDIVGAHSTCTMAAVEAMREADAVAIHVHALCDTLRERIAVAADLRPLPADQSLIAAAHARGQAAAFDLYGER